MSVRKDNVVQLDVADISNLDINDWLDAYKRNGIVPIGNDIQPSISPLKNDTVSNVEKYELLEYLVDCVLNEVVTRRVYVHLKSLIKTGYIENLELVRNILNQQCNGSE
jgi:hypothetical protein